MLAGGKTDANINITPLIDILLVLLITFMILPSHTRGLDSEAPLPSSDNQPAPPNPQHIVLRIRSDRALEINTQPVIFADLHARLQNLFAVRPDGVLFIDGSSELEFADVASVIDVAKGAGVPRIGLLTGRNHPAGAGR